MDQETIWYEVSPYLYVVAGVAALLLSRAPLSLVASALLIGAAVKILYMRRKNRRRFLKKTGASKE